MHLCVHSIVYVFICECMSACLCVYTYSSVCMSKLSAWQAHLQTLNPSSVRLHCSVTLVRGREGERPGRVYSPQGLSLPMLLGSSSSRAHRTSTHCKQYKCNHGNCKVRIECYRQLRIVPSITSTTVSATTHTSVKHSHTTNTHIYTNTLSHIIHKHIHTHSQYHCHNHCD